MQRGQRVLFFLGLKTVVASCKLQAARLLAGDLKMRGMGRALGDLQVPGNEPELTSPRNSLGSAQGQSSGPLSDGALVGWCSLACIEIEGFYPAAW